MSRVRSIDAHQHFWRYVPEDFPWIEPDSPIATDRLPQHLRPLLDAAGVDSCIAVQARQSLAETDWLLDLATTHDWIAGVVGWFDLRAPEIDETLERYRHATKLVGVRHVVQDEDDAFLTDERFLRGVRAALARGLAYDILIVARQASQIPRFLEQVGPGRLVLDHGGKPDIAAGSWTPWAEDIARIAEFPYVMCKISGLATQADHHRWQPHEIAPYLDHVLQCFGPERLVFGSDWAVSELAAPYQRSHDLVTDYIRGACPAHRETIMGRNARKLYDLPEEPVQ